MTWIERHQAERRIELLTFAIAGSALLVVFACVFALRGSAGLVFRQLLG
jgi:hypothetical protein